MLNSDFVNSLGLVLNDKQVSLLETYSNLVLEKNKEFNLTATKTFEEVWARHICDGLKMASVLEQEGFSNQTGADFGTGAGFIGLTCAIVLENTKIYLIDSLKKRTMFLQWVLYKLGLKNVEVLSLKLGQQKLPKKFNFTMERAMGEIDNILPICVDPLESNGTFFALLSETTKSLQTPQKEVFYTLPIDEKLNSRKISFYGH